MRWLIALLALSSVAVATDDVPEKAKQYLPVLLEVQQDIWPAAPIPSYLAAQVEQESCITLRHSRCWDPRAQLKTSREWGRGLGQVTTVYRPDGSVVFDKQAELRAKYPSLSGWTTARWADPHYQLTALVEMNKAIYGRQNGASSDRDRLGFSLSAYNGGEGGVLQDRRLCSNTPGCDQSKWFGHVEKTSLKSKTPKPGYKLSFYQINREYVRNVLDVRRNKYIKYFRDK